MRRLLLVVALVAGTVEASESVTSRAGVATGSRYATQAAITVLRSGGTAMDAATAAAFVLAVTRPDAAGLGGGGLLVYYDSGEQATWSVDFREAAPIDAAKPDDASTAAPPSRLAAAGTPGFVAGLREAQERFGTRPWKELLGPAILLAQEGFQVDAPLTIAMSAALEAKLLDDTTRSTLLGDSRPGTVPPRIAQPELAETLSRLSRAPGDFYSGTTAAKIAQYSSQSGGLLAIRDLREYRPVWRAPLRIDFGAHSIQTAPPPSRGGVAIASILAILSAYDLAEADLSTPGTSHLLAEADRRATFDSKRVVGDPAFTRIAIASILSVERAEFWRSTILPDRVTSTPVIVDAAAAPSSHTTHISIVDSGGSVASLTLSLGDSFGSGVMVPGTGVVLNAALRDFSEPSAHANARAPRKRPSTPLAPLIVFHEDRPLLAAGASGGDAIPSCLAGLIIRVTTKGSTIREAVEAPRLHQPDYPDRVVFESELEATAKVLEAMGHGIHRVESIGEINAVLIDGERIISVADPRGKGASGGY